MWLADGCCVLIASCDAVMYTEVYRHLVFQ